MILRAQRFSFLMEGKVAGEGSLDFLHIRQASARRVSEPTSDWFCTQILESPSS